MKRLFDNKPKVSQTFKLNAWLAVPGNEKKTVADYARHLKDNTVVQGEMK